MRRSSLTSRAFLLAVFAAGPSCDPDEDPEAPVPGSLLFSVSEVAEGLSDTAIAGQSPTPQSSVYHSRGTGSTREPGRNGLLASAADLGLESTADIDAISVLHADGASRMYFSVRDGVGAEGQDNSDVRRESQSGEVGGDVFFSRGIATASTASVFQGNTLYLDEAGLGQAPADDLVAFEFTPPAGQPLYFSVGAGAVGAAGTAVEAIPPDELGCTIFRSELDGTNTVALTCDDLGLSPGADVDAVVVTGTFGPQNAFFSLVGSPDILRTDGRGSSVVHTTGADLGLEADDDVDALAIRTPVLEDGGPPPPPPCPTRAIVIWDPLEGIQIGEVKKLELDDTGTFRPVGGPPSAAVNAFIPTSSDLASHYQALGPHSTLYSGVDFGGPSHTDLGPITIETEHQYVELLPVGDSYTVNGLEGGPVFDCNGDPVCEDPDVPSTDDPGTKGDDGKKGEGLVHIFLLKWNEKLIVPEGGPKIGEPAGGATVVTVDDDRGPSIGLFVHIGLGPDAGLNKVVPVDDMEDGSIELLTADEQAALAGQTPTSVFIATIAMDALMAPAGGDRSAMVATMRGWTIDPEDLGF